jgi:hypothetical protein
LGSEAIWIINGSLLLFLCLAGLLLSIYFRKSSSRGSDGSINPKNISIKVLAIAGGIVTAVSDTTAQEKVKMVCQSLLLGMTNQILNVILSLGIKVEVIH